MSTDQKGKGSLQKRGALVTGLPGDPRERYVNDLEAAAILGISPKTIQLWRFEKRGPPPSKFGTRTIRYRLSALLDWAAQHEVKQ